ncbi:MAG: DUF3300 domain-containing protein [Phycisphaeraceae bacterium]|nr:MAG: DUF3300 domain-containing protein [Phycisphaeraceae bacterium]
MKRSFAISILVSLWLGAGVVVQPCVHAQEASSQAQPSALPAIPGGSLSAADLENLVGPIALYPDQLLANVLAASVYPDEVMEAAKFMRSAGAKDKIDSRDWEAPVKAVARVPDVLKMMAEYQDWTIALGQAYLTQAQDVMATVQTLRKKARANGSLVSNSEQMVVVQQEIIYIQSADPEVVYVPSYEPTVVYVDDPYDNVVAAGLIGFGTGIIVGAIWADLDCDWHHGCVGWGDVDVDIDRNFNGDINIGNDVNIGSGNRVDHRNRVGQAGGAWSPNRDKTTAINKPDQRQNFRGANADGGSPRAAAPHASSAARPPARPTPRATPSSSGRTQTPSSSRVAGAARTPAAPSSDRAQSAFRGGSDTRASSSRGSSSRQSASRGSYGGSRSGGVSRGGGGRGGGRR